MLIKHPRIDTVTQDVPARDVPQWLAQGWVDITPQPPVSRKQPVSRTKPAPIKASDSKTASPEARKES